MKVVYSPILFIFKYNAEKISHNILFYEPIVKLNFYNGGVNINIFIICVCFPFFFQKKKIATHSRLVS